MDPPDSVDWGAALPSLTGALVILRDLRLSDAAALLSAVSSDQASRFISPPPTTVDGFERFITWSHRQREEGHSVCFAIVPRGGDAPIGLFQIRSLEPGFATAEWGFALAPEFWGTGVFTDGARLVIDFAFAVLGTHRLEARAAVRNARGNRALRKLGAVQEGVLLNRSCVTASTSTRRCGRFFTTTGSKPKPSGAIVWCTSLARSA